MSLASPLAAQEPRPGAFWRAAGDSTLTSLIARAFDANQELRAARSRIDGARAARTATALELAPIVNAHGAYARQRLASAAFPGAGGAFPDQDVWSAGALLSWEIDVFGRTRRTVQARGALAAATEEDLRDIRILVAAELATAYYDLRGAEERLATARVNAENQRNTLAMTLERLEAGRGNAFDTERARALLSTTLAEIPAIEAAIVGARHRISVLLGERPASGPLPVLPAGPLPVLPDSLGVSQPDQLVLERPDVRAARRRLQATRALVGAASAEYLPRISISGSAGYTSASAGSLGNSGTARYAIGPVVSWPAFDLGRVKAGVDAARADEGEAFARFEQAKLRAAEDIETALIFYRSSRDRLRHLDEAAAASERAAEHARVRFREGASDFLQVLDAERTLLAAQDRRAAARTEAHRGLVAVYRATGGGW